MAWVLFFALLLDAAFGEPKWLWSRLPHPAVLMGRVVTWCAATLNHGQNRKLKGVLSLIGLVLLGGALGVFLGLFGPVVEVLCAAVLLAQKSLVQHVQAVASGARYSLREGRRAVALIVGRDTANMDQPQVARAAIESAAENLSDGVVAPAFWLLLGGLPGLIIYKLVNTADSMIGYKTPALAEFGWASARFDDVLNWVPARITTVFIAIQGGVIHHWPAISQDAKKHRSPNAGWPEAALARALGVALAGPRSYDGTVEQFAWVNPEGDRAATPDDIDRAAQMLWITWGLMLGFVLLVAMLS